VNVIIANKVKSAKQENEEIIPPSLKSAIYSTFHYSNLPAKIICQKLNLSYQAIANGCMNNAEFKFSSRHLLPIMNITGNYSILKFLAYKTNHFIFKAPDKGRKNAGGALSIYFRIGKEQEKLLVLSNQYFAQNGAEDPEFVAKIDGVIWGLINNLAELRAAIKNKPTTKKGARNGK